MIIEVLIFCLIYVNFIFWLFLCWLFLFIRQGFLLEETFWNCLLECWMMTKVILLVLQCVRSISLCLSSSPFFYTYLSPTLVVLEVHVLWPFPLVCPTFLFVFASDVVAILNYTWFLVFMTLIGWRRDWSQVKRRRHGWPHCFPWLYNWMQSFPLWGVFLSLLPRDLIALFAFSNFKIHALQIFVIIWHGNDYSLVSCHCCFMLRCCI